MSDARALTLHSPLTPEQCVARIEERLRFRLARLGPRRFFGKVWIDEVRVWRNHRRRGFFQPEFRGVLIADGDGAQLTGGFRPLPGMVGAYYVFLVAFPLIFLILGATHSGGLNGVAEGLFPAVLSVPMTLLVGRLSRHVARNDPAEIEAFLRETIGAR